MQKKRINLNRSVKKQSRLGQKEKQRLIQFALCVCLFAVVFFGRGNKLFQENQTGVKLLQIVQENMDFTAAFSSLGESLSSGESVRKWIEVQLSELFGLRGESEFASGPVAIAVGPAYENAIQKLSVPISADDMVRFLGVEPIKNAEVKINKQENQLQAQTHLDEQETVPDEVEPEPELKPENVEQQFPVYDGPELPANASMEYLVLGLGTTEAPVTGEVSSGFGYREHPISEEHLFHAGVDIAADIGTPIKAFSDGVVEFIGESTKYGLYIQLDHGNGVKTFYCHCSELLYGKGKRVEVGQTIALVGDTGDTTGPHLHLELKKDNILLNPLYYIELSL